MNSAQIKIRFNTLYPLSSRFKWHVIEIKKGIWKEHFANEVVVGTISQTTSDMMENGETKHHFTITANNIIFESPGNGGFEKIVIL